MEEPKAILFNRRSDITKINYYLNREKNILKTMLYFSSNKKNKAANHYDLFYNLRNYKFNHNDKIILILREKNINSDLRKKFNTVEYLDEVQFKGLSYFTRNYYLYRLYIKK